MHARASSETNNSRLAVQDGMLFSPPLCSRAVVSPCWLETVIYLQFVHLRKSPQVDIPASCAGQDICLFIKLIPLQYLNKLMTRLSDLDWTLTNYCAPVGLNRMLL